MKDRISLSKNFKIICSLFIILGVVITTYGFISDPQRTWANYLLDNFYFLSLAIGGTFFLTIQSITQSGWSSGFKRIPEAMMLYIPLAGILILCLFFGMHYIYHWTSPVISDNNVIVHKSIYLNIPFFLIRLIFIFFIWGILIRLIRKASLREDEYGSIENFNKTEKYSKVFIFFLAISFTLISIDLVMSIDMNWYSTVFAFKNFIAAFLHGSATIFIIVVLLNRKGYFPFLNKSHIHDFARYIFIVSIFYGYMWFSQFMLIWYGNLPDETIYFAKRWTAEWQPLWAADIIINWAVPFFVLLPVSASRSKWIVFTVALILVFGLWIDLFVEIFPGAVGPVKLGFIEIGSYLGFAGLFSLCVGYFLSKANIIPKNHPYIEECYQHHFESYI